MRNKDNKINTSSLVFASHNTNKVNEINDLIGQLYDVSSLKEINCPKIKETGHTFKENAFIKANYVYTNYKTACFADDSGLSVEQLNGLPGVRSARFASEKKDDQQNMDKLLTLLDGKSNRNATFTTCICLIIKSNTYYFEGHIKGEISLSKKGTNGFGYDPIFIPKGYDKTFAELTKKQKNKISHRAIATEKLIDFLKKIKQE